MLFLILPSPSNHTAPMTIWSGVSQSRFILKYSHNLHNPGRGIRPVPDAQTMSSLEMHLLLGSARDWTYCQQLNNISVSSPYKKHSQKSVHVEVVALIVTRITLTIFSPAESKDELSSQLRVSISLPCFECAATWTMCSVLMVSAFKSGTTSQMEPCYCSQ